MAIESTRDLCLSVADAIREKKGTSELINPQDFAKEIASIEGGGSGGSGGGGALEGEYFLAKPNGRYWKFTFMPEGHRLRIEDFETSQVETMHLVYDVLVRLQNVCGAAVSSDDAGAGPELVRVDGFYNIGARMLDTLRALQSYLNGYNYDTIAFNQGFLRVWKECDIKSNPPFEYDVISLNSYSLIELVKATTRLQGMEITDDEAIPLIEQAFMLIPATEEEYKYWRLEDENY